MDPIKSIMKKILSILILQLFLVGLVSSQTASEIRQLKKQYESVLKKEGKISLSSDVVDDDEIEGDTGCLIIHKDLSVANMNDCGIDQKQINFIRKNCPNGHPTVALLTYAGAGPYPQTYYFENSEERKIAEKRKHDQFLKMYSDYCELLKPERAMPFAGSYVLGGPLSKHNQNRGVADAV